MNSRPLRGHNPAALFNSAQLNPDAAAGFPDLLAAAESGCLRAQFLVGLAYQLGRGVAVDYARAAAWYERAASAGDGAAMTNLGIMDLLGNGTPVDEIEAYAWLQSAYGLGHSWLRPVLEFLEARMVRQTAQAAPCLPDVAPEVPDLQPCTRPDCDWSRCNVA